MFSLNGHAVWMFTRRTLLHASLHLKERRLKPSVPIRGSDNYLGAQYRRIAARKGRQRAAVAVAHSIMTIAYHLLTRQEDYKDLGSDYFEKRHHDAIVKQTVRKLENLGFTVTLATSEAS
ncbi:hypothetical protein ABIC22_004784 [Paenibacillus sp. PvP094]|uniref:hypothetical protein n=1 Tax=Paenibacillus sp. PvP094 TaxID=3156394 RepID=UPI003395B732